MSTLNKKRLTFFQSKVMFNFKHLEYLVSGFFVCLPWALLSIEDNDEMMVVMMMMTTVMMFKSNLKSNLYDISGDSSSTFQFPTEEVHCIFNDGPLEWCLNFPRLINPRHLMCYDFLIFLYYHYL